MSSRRTPQYFHPADVKMSAFPHALGKTDPMNYPICLCLSTTVAIVYIHDKISYKKGSLTV